MIDKIVNEIKRIEEDARKVRVSKESTTNQAIGADSQVKLCQHLLSFINSIKEEK